jgi:hypothetical protein
MSDSNTIEFLKKRGFTLYDAENGLRIEITHRSIGAGLNEIFVESDELNAIEQLGSIIKIVYGDDTIKLSVKTRTQTPFEDNRTKDRSQELKERLEQREDEKGGK